MKVKEMSNQKIISDIESGFYTRKEIAPKYEGLFSHNGCDTEFWRPINEAIITRWSKSGLIFIKELAWKINRNRQPK